MSRAQSLSPSVSHHYPIFIWGIYLLTSSKQHLKQSRCALAISGNGIWHPSVTQIGSRWCLMRQLAVAWRSVEYVLSIDCVISWGKFHSKNKYVNICVYIYICVCVWLCVYVCIILTCCILSTHMRIYTYMCTKCGCLCVCANFHQIMFRHHWNGLAFLSAWSAVTWISDWGRADVKDITSCWRCNQQAFQELDEQIATRTPYILGYCKHTGFPVAMPLNKANETGGFDISNI